MSTDATMQKMLDRFRLKITKKTDDARKSFRGEMFIMPSNPKHDGTAIDGVKCPYAVIPAYEPDYIKTVCQSLGYVVSEPFLPGVDDKKETAIAEEEPAEKK